MPSATSPLRSALLLSSSSARLASPRLIDEQLMPSVRARHPRSALLHGTPSARLASPHRRTADVAPLCSALVLSSASARLTSSHRRSSDANATSPLGSASERRVCSSRLVSSTSRRCPLVSVLFLSAASARLALSHRRAGDAERDIHARLCFSAPRLLVLPRPIDEPAMPARL